MFATLLTNVANVGLYKNVGTKMKSKHTKQRTAALLFICAVIIAIASPSYASVPLSFKNGCNQQTGVCTGLQTGGGGSHNQGNTGSSGAYAGEKYVRFDGFAPNSAMTPCAKDTADLKLFGYDKNHPGPFYLHYRVAKDKATDEVLGGVDTAKFWNTAWDINTLQPTTQPVKEGDGLTSESDSVFGPHFVFKNTPPVCLPLKGGFEVKAAETGVKPQIALTKPGKLVVNAKNREITIVADKTDLIAANAAIFFTLDDSKTTLRVSKMNNDGTWTELDLAASKRIVKISSIEPVGDGKTFHANITAKKKGVYKVAVKVHFDVDIIVNGTFSQDFLEIESADLPIAVVSVKSVSRSGNN